RRHHDSIVGSHIKQLVTSPRPGRVSASRCGNLPFAAGTRKRANKDFTTAGFVGVVCEPSAVRREHRFTFVGGAVAKYRLFSGLPTRRLVAFHWQNHDVGSGLWIRLLECQVLAGRMPRTWKLSVPGVGKPLNLSRSVRILPIEIRHSFVASGYKDNTPT